MTKPADLIPCTGDVFPTTFGAVEAQFVELFYTAGERVALRFEGMPDLYIADSDACRIARAVNTGNESQAGGPG